MKDLILASMHLILSGWLICGPPVLVAQDLGSNYSQSVANNHRYAQAIAVANQPTAVTDRWGYPGTGMESGTIFQRSPVLGMQGDQHSSVDIMDTRNNRLIDYRRMFRHGVTPTREELIGNWRGVNKGIVELVGYNQFIKEIKPEGFAITGDNIMVQQISNDMLRSVGWQAKPDPNSFDGLQRKGKFAIENPRGIGVFKKGAVFNYRKGNNPKSDPVRLLVDKVIKIDDRHLLGRATANFGPLQIPLAYFVLERIDGPIQR